MSQQPNLLLSFLPMIAMVIVFYFLLIRPQQKKQKEVLAMRSNIAVNDDVVTIGGIRGKVLLVKEDYIVMESSATKTRLDVMKWGISSVESKKSKQEEL
ncbi:preprotein translocase subunit YajC [Peptoniphilus equinus]|uniref:Preprotein translocase subunit YajC n=1 Tax=Peptoniphilus equinus TaxID=3016343 RepID=A0ABY7QWP7_9FIRM|nr:preprotein translocase subunit YajC [Peptoniphilus equinus]WBW50648.1 preprotein translocase subunit YajC [Peptoniphilus equinus]